ncbi:csn2, partial [Symbiodinium sp. KB8]
LVVVMLRAFAEEMRLGNTAEALAKFESVVEQAEGLDGTVEFAFKALLSMVTILIGTGDFASAKGHYATLLSKLSSVTANDANDAVDSVLEAMSGTSPRPAATDPSASDPADFLLLLAAVQIYSQTLALTKDTNQRLWFSTLSKLAALHLESKNTKALRNDIKELHASCRDESGNDDESKGTQLMEIYALRIQLASITRDYSALASMDERVRALSAFAIVDPRISGIVKEAFAAKAMANHDWEGAYNDYREAFTSFQKAGSPRAVQCLRYTLLANMVANMAVDPFDSPEAKAYQRNPLIAAMVSLRQAFERDDMAKFDEVLRHEDSHILDDETMIEYLEPLFRNFRSRVVLRRVKAYRTVRLEFLATELKLSVEEVEELLASLILDGRLQGTLDQVDGILSLSAPAAAVQGKTFKALSDVVRSLGRVHAGIVARSGSV